MKELCMENPEKIFRRWLGMISLGSLLDMIAALSIIDTQSKTSMSRERLVF